MFELMESTKPAQKRVAENINIARICRLIPPLWDLRNFVAVNPFLGFSSQSIASSAQAVKEAMDAELLPRTEYYRSRWNSGELDREDLRSSARAAGMKVDHLEAILTGKSVPPLRSSQPYRTFAERLDHSEGTDWHETLIRTAARWCAVYASNGGRFTQTKRRKGLFEYWKEAATVDRSLELAGLQGFRSWIAQIPLDAGAAIHNLLERQAIGSPRDQEAYLYRLLCGLYGWASYFRRLAWEQDPKDPGLLIDLLAILICLDTAVAELAPKSKNLRTTCEPRTVEDETYRIVMQDALEDHYLKHLLQTIQTVSTPSSGERPRVQAVFCIDVRSEPLRRHLESLSPDIETRGFAGFFGISLNWQTGAGESARCPVLLKPTVCVHAGSASGTNALGSAITHLQGAPGSAFSYVEFLGMAYGIRLVKNSIFESHNTVSSESHEPFSLTTTGQGAGIPAAIRVDLASGILKNMGFSNTFARLVILCGHEGHSVNNPHAAGLDCGACGGHGGAINARIAAAILNDPEMRAQLPSRGWTVPEDTHFLPAVHDTSTDDVHLLDTDRVPKSHEHDLNQLRSDLISARSKVQHERSPALGVTGKKQKWLDRILRRRARDWSEVRPEWALARNASFIAARRVRTRGANLEGRTFLHEYDSAHDPDDSILTLILSAPMVVASWINLQYFASTVDNLRFGSGDKTIQNRVGSLGVVLGNGGDLRTGLPLQSVHSAYGRWYHEPLRLQVIVEAAPEKIDRVLDQQVGVKELVENGWVRLFSLNPDCNEAKRYRPGRGWESM